MYNIHTELDITIRVPVSMTSGVCCGDLMVIVDTVNLESLTIFSEF